jgi:hypothetical protein
MLFPSKSIKGSNYGEFLKDNNVFPGCAYFFLKILSLLLFLAEESRHFSIDMIVALFPGHSSETMFHLVIILSRKSIDFLTVEVG